VALLEVTDLHTQFVTRDGVVRAVDGVTFAVDSGETVGIVGESGCGKSVTALSIMRLLATPPGRISEGSILFDGTEMTSATEVQLERTRGARIAMIFQDPMTSLNPVLTIGRQIEESLRLHLRLDGKAARSRATELLRMVRIPNPERCLNEYPHQLSGGMRQRVMIALAIACNPKLVLADEPTTALDVTIQAQILDVLRSLTQQSQTTLILITHDLGVVAGMTERVIVMYAGRIIEQADTDDLFSNPRSPYTWGLLRSIPRLDGQVGTKLVPIEGLPPDLIDPPTGCRFEPRCQYRREICSAIEPDLLGTTGTTAGHMVRCWGTQDVPEGGWLLDTDWRTETGRADVLDEIRHESGMILTVEHDADSEAAG
jgi:oligopeptide transport system ATP-binding protein